MDFPLVLNADPRWVYGRTELQQNIGILFQNPISSFLQSSRIGAQFSVHTDDIQLIEEGVRKTLSQVPYITIQNIEVELPSINCWITYNGETINFQYSIEV